ncbi:MAG: hypothetical protein WKG01_38125 [Kofleriaceae bacterium]
MRLLTLPKLLLLGGAVALLLGKRRRTAAPSEPARTDAIPDADPADPVQGFDDVQPMHLDELAFDARATADYEVAHDLASLENTFDEGMIQLEAEPLPDVDSLGTPTRGDDGIRYGVHTLPAMDRSQLDGDSSFEAGENWVEALQASAIEDAEPEHEVDDIEALFDPPHGTDTRDIPLADLGAGGPRGL